MSIIETSNIKTKIFLLERLVHWHSNGGGDVYEAFMEKVTNLFVRVI